MINNLIEDTFGKRIKVARVSKGLTQEKLAEIMYIPKSTISAYENDKVDVKKSTIDDLVRVLGRDANYWFGMKPEATPFVQKVTEFASKIEDEADQEMTLTMLEAVIKRSKKR